jgi:hypothetical protein
MHCHYAILDADAESPISFGTDNALSTHNPKCRAEVTNIKRN